MNLENVVAERIEVKADPVITQYSMLEAQTEAIATLTESIAELTEKIHDLERSVAYSLGER